METILEYRKGILFIRLIGKLTKETSSYLEAKVNDIIKENQITNVVLNIEKMTDIDQKGIHILYYIYELSKKNKGRTLICNIDNDEIKEKLRKNRIFKYIKEINNELIAFQVIEI